MRLVNKALTFSFASKLISSSLYSFQKWKEESVGMNKTLADANEAASKMTVHDDPDKKHAENMKRWEVNIYLPIMVMSNIGLSRTKFVRLCYCNIVLVNI